MGNTAGNPYPPNGDTNGASPNVSLRWDAGAGAASVNGHDLYFGTNQTAVLNGEPAAHIGVQSATGWAPPTLTAGTTYYWRVDELSSGVPPSRWVGSVWSFVVFDGTQQPAGYANGYATWCVDSMTLVNLNDSLPAGSPTPPAAGMNLAQCESAAVQVVIQPASGRRLDNIRLILRDLTSGANALAAANLSWQLVGVVTYGNVQYADILLPARNFDAAIGNTHSVLVTVLAPAGTPAGLYAGTLTVQTDSGLDTAVSISANVYQFEIPAASTIGSMHLRTTWTLNDFNSPAQYPAYGDCLLSYRMCPDNIYRNAAPDVDTLGHWYSLGLNTFSVYKADNLWHTGDLQAQGVDAFFTALAASPHGSQLRGMAQFYGYDEKDVAAYGDAAGQSGMRATYGTIKAAYPDVPTTTTAHMYLSPWADPIGDMSHYHCDWMCAEQSLYNYSDGQLLRSTVDPGLPNKQRFQYWAYGASLVVGKLLTGRSLFWSLFQQQADGFLYYSVNGWVDDTGTPTSPPLDPASGPILNYVIPGSSRATLLYYGATGPLASMRMVNVRDGMQDWEYLWAIGHYDTDGVTRLGKIASVETARELAEQISINWVTSTDPTQLINSRKTVAAWLSQPYVARYPLPEHRSKGVSVRPILAWQSDSVNVGSFNVYFGTDRNAVLNATPACPEFHGNQTPVNFQPPSTLARNTNYYWRIDEVVNTQVYKGYVWSFSCSYGLVGWWKFDEPAGAVATDSSTLGHHARIVNANHISGIQNNALQFNGAGYVSIPAAVLATVAKQVTVAFWLRGADAQPQDQVIFEALTATGLMVLRGQIPAGDLGARFEAGAGDVINQPLTLTQAKSRWQHWAFTKNADTGHMRIYFNGVPFADVAGRTHPMELAAAFTVGSKCNHTRGYEGTIDELRVYDGELQAADILAVYQIGDHRGDCGLMGWWRFDELSGASVKDWSDLQNHGTLRSPIPAHNAGQIGNCLTCNGPMDYVDVPVNGMTFPTPAVTLALWTFGDSSLPNPISNYGSTALSALKTDGTTGLFASIPASNATGFFRGGGDTGADSKLTGVLAANQYKGQWNHWVFVRDFSGTSNIYVNGSLVAADGNGSTDACGPFGQLRIGARSGAVADYPYLGKLDEVRLYNYPLAANEVTAIYTADQTNVSGEVGHWKFDEDNGTTTADATQFGHNATIYGAAWAQGRIGAALKFDGSNSRVEIPAASLALLDKQVTVTLWLRGPANIHGEHCVFEALDASGGLTIRATVGERSATFDAGFGGAGHLDSLPHTGPHALQPEKWSHWAFTKNAISGLMSIYINGTLWTHLSEKYRPMTTAGAFVVGAKADGQMGFVGRIDDLRIFNLELSATDIQQIYLDCPPLPNPMTWSAVPHANGPTSVSMTASAASHPNGVEYYFECVSGGGHDSGWQVSPAYMDMGLTPRSQYAYQTKARENGPNQNETRFSSVEPVTTGTFHHLP
jgi:Concanavalin A-like lectin/glucanases superfamily/Domain of unknown function (DUF4091)